MDMLRDMFLPGIYGQTLVEVKSKSLKIGILWIFGAI
jgi:hypothetical protein